MRVKLDENMPSALIDVLCSAGHDVTTAREENLSGVEDPIVLRTAAQEARLLMTFDVGFGDIRSYPLGSHAGIVVFRLKASRERPARAIDTSGDAFRAMHHTSIRDARESISPYYRLV